LPIESAFKAMEGQLAGVFAGTKPNEAEENLQSRLRGVTLMALSNKFGSLVLTTGNKSEMAVGYCTLYGDMCGALAVIADVFKTEVYALSRWINRDRVIIPTGFHHQAAERRVAARSERSGLACRPTKCSTPFCNTTWWNTSARTRSSIAVLRQPW
jgi:NH3-dependent NAD+ synthetase